MSSREPACAGSPACRDVYGCSGHLLCSLCVLYRLITYLLPALITFVAHSKSLRSDFFRFFIPSILNPRPFLLPLVLLSTPKPLKHFCPGLHAFFPYYPSLTGEWGASILPCCSRCSCNKGEGAWEEVPEGAVEAGAWEACLSISGDEVPHLFFCFVE